MPPLPVEVCQAILRHSIYVPRFFDPDAYEGDLMAFGFGDPCDERLKKFDWAVEKTRNNLRLVCWAWNEYLLGFEHRFVKMSDVMHGRVDQMFLKNAIRISFVREYCLCDVCIVQTSNYTEDYRRVHDRFAQFCWETIVPFGFLPAEIVDFDEEIIKNGNITGVMEVLTRAKVLVSVSSNFAGFHRPFFIQTANVEHIRGHIYESRHLAWTTQKLVTVSFNLVQWSSEGVKPELPSLRHLRIDGWWSESSGATLRSLLQQVGDQLRSLYIHGLKHDYQMPVDIWETCPNLEKFHPGMVLPVSPPMSHPLHTLSVMPKHLSSAATLQFPNLRRLLIDAYWGEIGGQGVTYLVSIWTTSLIDRVTVEDLKGIPLAHTLPDTDISLLEDCYKCCATLYSPGRH